MRDAADHGMVITLKCNLCRRSARYWAADLVKVVGPLHEVHVPPFDCSGCEKKGYVRVEWAVPGVSEMDGLTVRRPVKQISKWIWRNEKA